MKNSDLMPMRLEQESNKAWNCFITHLLNPNMTLEELSELCSVSIRQIYRFKRQFKWTDRAIQWQQQQHKILFERQIEEHLIELANFRDEQFNAANNLQKASLSLLQKALLKIESLTSMEWDHIDPVKLAVVLKHSALCLGYALDNKSKALAIDELIAITDMDRKGKQIYNTNLSNDIEEI